MYDLLIIARTHHLNAFLQYATSCIVTVVPLALGQDVTLVNFVRSVETLFDSPKTIPIAKGYGKVTLIWVACISQLIMS